MAKNTQRRKWGTVTRRKVGGRYVWMALYPTPVWAYDRWPELELSEKQRCPLGYAEKPDDPKLLEWLEQERYLLEHGNWTPVKLRQQEAGRETVTFSEYTAQWLQARKDGTTRKALKPTTIKQYEKALETYLLPAFGDTPMVSLSHKMVRKWFDGFQPAGRGDRDKVRYATYTILKAIMASAAKEPWGEDGSPLIGRTPCVLKAQKPQVSHEAVRPDEGVWALLMATLPEWAAMAATIMDEAGLRRGEVMALTLSDLETGDAPCLHVVRQVQRVDGKTLVLTPKNGTSRDVYISEALAEKIVDYARVCGAAATPELPLFPAADGGFRAPDNLSGAMRQARLVQPALGDLRSHDLRKDGLSRMGEHGASVGEIMRQGGHKSMAVASRYQVVDGSHMAGVMASVGASTREFPVVEAAQPERATPEQAWDAAGLEAYTDAELASFLADLEPAERKGLLGVLPAMRKLAVLKLERDMKAGA